MIDLREIECTVLEYQISVLNELGKCYEKEFFMEADGDQPAGGNPPASGGEVKSENNPAPAPAQNQQNSGGENKSEATPENKPQEGNNQSQNNQQNNNNQQQNSKWEKFKNWFKEMMKKISDFFKKLFGKTTEADRVVQTLEGEEETTNPEEIAAANKAASEPVQQQPGQPFSNYGTIKCDAEGVRSKLMQYYPNIAFNLHIEQNPQDANNPIIKPTVVYVVGPKFSGGNFFAAVTEFINSIVTPESNALLACVQNPNDQEKKKVFIDLINKNGKTYEKMQKEFTDSETYNKQMLEQLRSGANVKPNQIAFSRVWKKQGGGQTNAGGQSPSTSDDYIGSSVFLRDVVGPYNELVGKVTAAVGNDNAQLPQDMAQAYQAYSKHTTLTSSILKLFSDREAELAKLATDEETLLKIANEINATPTQAQVSQDEKAKEKQKLDDTINENKQLTEQNQKLQQQLQQAGATQPAVQPQVASQPAPAGQPAVQPPAQPTLVPSDSTEFGK